MSRSIALRDNRSMSYEYLLRDPNAHNPPPEPLTDNRQTILPPLQRIQENIMPLRAVKLGLPYRPHRLVLRAAERTLHTFILNILVYAQTPLMETMLA